MSFRDSVRKYQKLIDAKNNKVTMIWIACGTDLTAEQLESKTNIYLYLEI